MSDGHVPTNCLLTVRVSCARGLSLPSGESVPPLIQQALSGQQATAASSVTLQSVRQYHRLAQRSGNRDGLQRKQYWWLPYIILEFDKDEVLIGSVGGTIQEPVWMFQARFDVRRVSEITLQLYLHNGTRFTDLGNNQPTGSDLFLGNVTFVPDFDRQGTVDQWYDITNVSGQVNIAITFKASTQSLSVDSFDLVETIGKGPYGYARKVTKKDTSRVYALHKIPKAHRAMRSEITHTLVERTVLANVKNPFIVPLKFSFQTPERLYLVLPFMNGGELVHHLQREQRFDEERSRFYAGELLLALEHLHGLDVVCRDFEPENILLDYTGHIALCNVALCKYYIPDQATADTFYGPLEYLAPEVLLGCEYSNTADWWIFGVFLYEMLTGRPPFYDENQYEMYRRILQDPLRFGDEVGPDARSLLTALLTRDPSQRLGVNGAEEIKRHPFFSKCTDFEKLSAKKIQPPVAGALHTSHFNQAFTS